jgi:hypothetical protein
MKRPRKTRFDTDPSNFDAGDRKVLEDITRFGWHVVGVLADESGPAFSFTIGLLHQYGHPEILIAGLEAATMHPLLNQAGRLIKSGAKFADGSRSDDLLDGFPVELRSVHPAWYRDYLGYACWFYLGDDFPCLQCVWPDKKRRFPWDAKFERSLLPLQPALWKRPG